MRLTIRSSSQSSARRIKKLNNAHVGVLDGVSEDDMPELTQNEAKLHHHRKKSSKSTIELYPDLCFASSRDQFVARAYTYGGSK